MSFLIVPCGHFFVLYSHVVCDDSLSRFLALDTSFQPALTRNLAGYNMPSIFHFSSHFGSSTMPLFPFFSASSSSFSRRSQTHPNHPLQPPHSPPPTINHPPNPHLPPLILSPPGLRPLKTLKQCLHYDPDSKPCLTLHRTRKRFDKGFIALDQEPHKRQREERRRPVEAVRGDPRREHGHRGGIAFVTPFSA